MIRGFAWCIAIAMAAGVGALQASETRGTDSRLQVRAYDAQSVVTLAVKRGVITLVLLDADEAIREMAAGLGGDCSKADSTWCIAGQSGGRHIFIKPKSGANGANTLAVITDKRAHAFRFVVMDDHDPKPPVYRLNLLAPPAHPTPAKAPALDLLKAWALAAPAPAEPDPGLIVAARLQAKPPLKNANYSVAEGKDAQDIVPDLVFDDGRFTYLRFGGNRPVTAVFEVLPDGSETVVNARMEDDLLVIDRVARHWMLRAGAAAVGLWNEAFDIGGVPPVEGTTAEGVQRVLRPNVPRAKPDGGKLP